jgi:transcriptional regulator with XRE-family HTH domain
MIQTLFVSNIGDNYHIFIYMTYIGQNIKNIREYWGLTQTEFGWLVDASRGMIMQYENKRSAPKTDTLSKISDVLNIHSEVLSDKLFQPGEYPEMSDFIKSGIERYRLCIYETTLDQDQRWFKAGKIIKDLRENTFPRDIGNITQKLNISESILKSYERGEAKPSLKTLQALSMLTAIDKLVALYYPEVYKKNGFTLTFPPAFGFDLLGDDEENEIVIHHNSYNSIWQGVPIYDTAVSAGMLSLIRDESTPEPAYYLPVPGFKDCKFGARVSGDSMYPEIRNGDFVICKEVTDFIFGDIYLVITKDGQETVKHVHPNDNPELINLVPSNTAIPITPLPKASIVKVYKVKGVIKSY